jgi:hypothetical protein
MSDNATSQQLRENQTILHAPLSQPVEETAVYQIRLKGQLGSEWTDWFGGLTIAPEDTGDTLLTGPVIDQAALYSVLRKVRDLGLPLLSLMLIHPEQTAGSAGQD